MGSDIARDLVTQHGRELFGFLHVDWAPLWQQALTSEEPDLSVDWITGAWIAALTEHRGSGTRWSTGANFHVVEFPADARAAAAQRFAEEHYAALLRYLGGIAKPLATPMPLLLFARFEDFLSYHAAFDAAPADLEQERTLATSGGMFLGYGMPQILMPLNESLEGTLAHELTHALVCHLPLPLWLNEGLAVSMENLLMHRSALPSMEDIAEHRARWTPEAVQGFWTGASFRDPEWQRLSYQLAHGLLATLARDYERLVQFANTAHWDDAGRSACRTVYGQDLGRLPQGMLRPGDWGPKPETWSGPK